MSEIIKITKSAEEYLAKLIQDKNELTTYLTMDNSNDTKDCLETMEKLRPCRLRKWVDATWNVIYK